MSSREIAELTGKEHADVMRDARNMFDQLGLVASSFAGYYVASNGKSNPLFNLPKDLTLTLVSGYSVPLRHRIVTRLQELESAKAQPVVALGRKAEGAGLRAPVFSLPLQGRRLRQSTARRDDKRMLQKGERMVQPLQRVPHPMQGEGASKSPAGEVQGHRQTRQPWTLTEECEQVADDGQREGTSPGQLCEAARRHEGHQAGGSEERRDPPCLAQEVQPTDGEDCRKCQEGQHCTDASGSVKCSRPTTLGLRLWGR
jgi:hypothetical protein